MKKVRFEIDERVGERTGERLGKVERTGMWTSTKHDSETTARQSLHAVARRAGVQLLDESAGVPAWSMAFYSKLPSAKRLIALVTRSGIRPLRKWLRSFSEFTHPK
jgi:trans-aconitate methyltransferase